MVAIELSSLSVLKSPAQAVRDVSLSVKRTETVAFFSQDGSADLLLLALAGILPLGEGQAQIFGYDLKTQRKKASRLLAFTTGETEGAASAHLTVKENLTLLCRLHGKRKKEAADRAARLMASFDLSEKANVWAKDLPFGCARRLNVAMAMAYDPSVLLLKNPTKDLNALQRRELLAMLGAQKEKRAVVFSSPDPFVCTAIADRIAVFGGGRLLAFDTKQALQNATGAASAEEACLALLQKEGSV